MPVRRQRAHPHFVGVHLSVLGVLSSQEAAWSSIGRRLRCPCEMTISVRGHGVVPKTKTTQREREMGFYLCLQIQLPHLVPGLIAYIPAAVSISLSAAKLSDNIYYSPR